MDELRTLREFRETTRALDPGVEAAARARLRGAAAGRHARPRAPRGMVPATAALVVVALVLGVSVLLNRTEQGRVTTAPVDASAYFEQLAVRAAASPDVGEPAGRVWFARTNVANAFGLSWQMAGSPAALSPTDAKATYAEERRWSGPHALLREGNSPLPPDAIRDRWLHDRLVQDNAAFGQRDGDPSTDRYGIPVFGARSLRWEQFFALPSDPAGLDAALRQALRGGQQPGNPLDTVQESAARDAVVAEVAADLLGGAPARPALRAALFRVIGRLPGLHMVGAVEGPEGGPAYAAAITDTAGEHEVRILVDDTTGRVVAIETRAADGNKWGAPAGVTITFTRYVESAYVARKGDRP